MRLGPITGRYMNKEVSIVFFTTPFNWKRPSRWIAPLIRKITGSPFSHVGIAFKEEKESMFAESALCGVRIIPFSAIESDIVLTSINPQVSDKNAVEAIVERAMSRVGRTSYDFRNLFIKQLVFQLFGVWIPEKKAGKELERFICSEYVAWCLDLEEPHKYSPASLYNKLQF